MVYSDPTSATINVDMQSAATGYSSLMVLDAEGRQVMKENTEISSNNLKLDVSGLASGMYFLRISYKKGTLLDVRFEIE